MIDSELVEAMTLWTGWRSAPFPQRVDDLVLARYGSAKGQKILSRLKCLEDDFYKTNAHLTESDLESMGIKARIDFLKKHPAIPKEVVDALAWCYTFDYK